MPPAAAHPLVRQPVSLPPPRTGSGFLMIFAVAMIVVLVGRVFDYLLVGYRLPAILCTLSLLACLVGGALPLLRTRIGLPHIALIAWMTLAIVFSSWRGGSFNYVKTYIIVTLMWVPIAAGPRHMGDVRKLIYLTIAFYLGLLVFAAEMEGARLEAASGTHGNSEDIALIAGFILPLCLYVASRIRFEPFRWVLIATAVLFTVRTVALTGSRAGMLALAIFALVALYRMSGVKRLLVAGAVAAGLVFVVVTVPDHLKERLGTIFHSFSDLPDERLPASEAIESTRERRKVLMDSIWFTVTHPIFGVGPGQFAEYRWSTAKQEGVFKAALVTHNTYTQLSSESGIPALLLYLAFLYGIHKTLRRAWHMNSGSDPESRDYRLLIFNLEMSLLYFAVCAIFISLVHYAPQFVIAGLALAVERLSSRRPAPAPAPAPPPALSAGGPKFEDRSLARPRTSLLYRRPQDSEGR